MGSDATDTAHLHAGRVGGLSHHGRLPQGGSGAATIRDLSRQHRRLDDRLGAAGRLRGNRALRAQHDRERRADLSTGLYRVLARPSGRTGGGNSHPREESPDEDLPSGAVQHAVRIRGIPSRGAAVTPEQIDALPAGRELDALVAEKVMGWTITAWASGEPWGNREIFEPSGRGPHRKAAHVPTYSTDIAAAWEVVQKLEAD